MSIVNSYQAEILLLQFSYMEWLIPCKYSSSYCPQATINFDEDIPSDVCSLIDRLCDLQHAPFQERVCLSFPSPSPGSKLFFFLNLPKVHGMPLYAADLRSSHVPPEGQDACRKYSSHHPTLTPGVFTIYCPHGVCCGFEVMHYHESPQHPFEIFFTRFLVTTNHDYLR